ncbi:MAG: MaoC family dehydratase N-terminal domain-containing protein [Proteobacteria bacterium]|nr:MaoC family dehydratase N-terminal domain-containing protein [Pseudomonadota bacterium]
MLVYSAMMGLTSPAVTETLEDRWVSNYAAAVADTSGAYYDNRGAVALPAHPAYLSHLEWDAIGILFHSQLGALTPQERMQGVHVFNSTRLHRPLKTGDTISATATVVGVERHRAGAWLTIRIDSVDDAQRPVATSYTSTLFRGVEVDTEKAPVVHSALNLKQIPSRHGKPIRTQAIEIATLAPFIFSECARDYGAIHTDMKVAQQAGLPGLILHGTAIIAYALSALTQHEAGGNPSLVQGFQTRLTGMVLCPSVMTLQVYPSEDPRVVVFDVMTEQGTPALSDGLMVLGGTR